MRALGRCKRDANEPEIVEELREAGCSVLHIEVPGDLLVGINGRTLLLEVKSFKGKLRQSQIDFAASWKGHYAVVRSAKEAVESVFGKRPPNVQCELCKAVDSVHGEWFDGSHMRCDECGHEGPMIAFTWAADVTFWLLGTNPPEPSDVSDSLINEAGF